MHLAGPRSRIRKAVERRVKRGKIRRASPCGPRRCPQRAAPRSAAADTRGAPLAVRTARIAPRGAWKQRAQEGIVGIYACVFGAGRTGDRHAAMRQWPMHECNNCIVSPG